jgi:hypothetical protein
VKKVFWLLVLVAIVAVGLAAIWSMYWTHERPDFTNSDETRRVDSYNIVGYKDGEFIIEHRGQRITAKCRNSVTWEHDPNGPGSPMDEHDCIYMHSMLGKTIGEDLMKQTGNVLVYYPWAGVNTVQTADNLDITDGEAVAPQPSPAHPSPQQQKLTAREYFNELRDANSFNTYSDKYVCFRDDDVPSFTVVAAAEDVLEEMARSGNKEDLKTMSKDKVGSGLFVHTYYKGVANGDPLFYDKVDDGYRIDITAPIHDRLIYKINWKTGRYLFQQYLLDHSKTVPVSEYSGKCELIHSGDTPSIAGEPKTR